MEDSFDIAPVGVTPGEHAFSWLVARIRARGARTIDEFGWIELHQLLQRLNEFGAASMILSDGKCLDRLLRFPGRGNLLLQGLRTGDDHKGFPL